MTFLPWFSLSFRATLLASLRHSAMVLYALTLAETALFAANRWHSGIAPLHRSVSQCLQVAVGATPRANRWLGCEIARGARAPSQVGSVLSRSGAHGSVRLRLEANAPPRLPAIS